MKKKSNTKRAVLAVILLMFFVVFVALPYAKPSSVIIPSTYQVLQNYQNDPNGGNGWLRIYTFNPMQNEIKVQTYSPYLEAFEDDENSHFSLPYEMNGTEKFSVIVLPDTQYYSANHPEIFESQVDWIINNRWDRNIKFVIHLGDVVDNMFDSNQWVIAENCMNKLEQIGIPYSILPGNHDFDENNPTSINVYESHFGDVNRYFLFEVQETKLLVLSLQYKPNSEVIAWANTIISSYPEYKVILATHEYLSESGWLPGARTATGEMLYKQVVTPHKEQVFLVLSGHFTREDLVIDALNPLKLLTWWI